MKMILQNYKTGEIVQHEGPVPACKPGGVLVRTVYSAISPGTEMMKISESKLSLIGKARARPDQVKKVLQTLAQQGPMATYEKVMQRLDMLTPLGYSTAGTVVEVGNGVNGIQVGDRVACAGNAHALHAEFNWVPVNLLAKVPDGVPLADAAFATIASIALQGIRQANPKPGEWACVVGLGLIGQLVVSMLAAFGVKTIGLDLLQERCDLATKRGAIDGLTTGDGDTLNVVRRIDELTRGRGCDHILIAAGGASNGPIELAPQIARDRARVTVIGKTGLELSWNAYYEKEMEVSFSRSYGPGRYDPSYEIEGNDYPIGYVRWTEQRNLEYVLELMADGRLDIAGLISSEHLFETAAQALEEMNKGKIRGIGFVFKYSQEQPITRATPRPLPTPAIVGRTGDRVRIAGIGCGNYASSMIYPHLVKRSDVQLAAVATTTTTSAINATRKFGFERMTTDTDSVIADPGIDAIVIATRHSSHARLVAAALEAGKAVFVEKPLALTLPELGQVAGAIEKSGNQRLLVGFNRRFSPMMRQLKDLYGACSGNQAAVYRVNAGPLEKTSWYLDRAAEGSRFVGEGGHFIDTLSWWFGADPVGVSSMTNEDDVIVTLRYPQEMGTIIYATAGSPRYPKERFEVLGGQQAAVMDNFRRIQVWSSGGKTKSKSTFTTDKGQKDALAAFLSAVKSGAPMPISPSSLLATTRYTIMALDQAAEPGSATDPIGVGVAQTENLVEVRS